MNTLYHLQISHLVGCLFILSLVSFDVQKLVSLLRSHLFNFAFISFALDAKEYCYNFCQRLFCLCFPLGIVQYLVLHLSLKSILSFCIWCQRMGIFFGLFACLFFFYHATRLAGSQFPHQGLHLGHGSESAEP